MNYASGHSQDLATMEASFRLAEIKELRDNAWHKREQLLKQTKKLCQERQRQTQDSIAPSPKDLIDIYKISAIAFHLNARRDNNELFSTSIYKIDHKL